MLYTKENIELNALSEYMDRSAMTEKQIEITEEQKLINSVFTDFQSTSNDKNPNDMNFGGGLKSLTRKHDHSTLDKFKLLISIGSEIQSIRNTSANGF